MTVKSEGLEITLTGNCEVGEAEILLSALLESPQSRVVLAAERIHTALWQILIAMRPHVEGRPPDGFSGTHILPLIIGGDGAMRTVPESTGP